MRFIRTQYILFAFATLLVVLSAHRALFNSGHLSNHDWIVSGISLILWCYFGYFSYKTFSSDFRYAKGGVRLDRRFGLKMTRQNTAITIGPISGEGRCQLRLYIKRFSKQASCDEFKIL